MTKTLFMASFELVSERMGERDRVQRMTRLVWGVDDQQARKLIHDEYQTGDSFGGRTLVRSLEMTEPLGSPD
jgi:hypothetical protein